MKKVLMRLLSAGGMGLFLVGMLLVGNTKVQAAALGQEVYIKSSSTTLYYDMDGNGTKDMVRILCGKKGYSYENIRIYINGKIALNKNLSNCSHVYVQYLSCTSKKNYLQVSAFQAGDELYMGKIYSYSGGKLVEAADLKYGWNITTRVTKVTSGAITIQCFVQVMETGRITWDFVYKPNGNKLKLKSNTASAKSMLGSMSYNDGYQKYFQNNRFVTARKRTYYTSYNLKNKAFTTKVGDVLTLSKVKIVNKKVYLNFTAKGKSGWIKATGNYDPAGEWFRGVSRRLAG